MSIGGLGHFSLQKTELQATGTDAFQSVLADTSLHQVSHHRVYPYSKWDDSVGVLEFVIDRPASDMYLDLSSVRVEGEWFVQTQSEGGAYEDVAATDTNISVVNFLPLHLWRSIEVHFGSSLVNRITPFNAGIKSVWEHDLSLSQNARQIYLPHLMQYEPDDNKKPHWTENSGATKRNKNYVIKSPRNHFSTLPPADVFAIGNYLPPIVTIRLRLIRNPMDYLLLHKKSPDKKYVLRCENLSLAFKRYQLNPSIVLQHQKLLAKNDFKFPLLSTEVKTFPLSVGLQNLRIPSLTLINEPRPVALQIFFLDSAGMLGDCTLTPHISQDPGLQRVTLHADHREVQPGYDFTKTWAMTSAYMRALEALGAGFYPAEYCNDGLTLDKFKNQLFHLTFSLTPIEDRSVFSESGHHPPLSLNVQLKSPTVKNITIAIYATYFSALTINGAGETQLRML